MTNRDLMTRRLYDYRTLTIIGGVQSIYNKKIIIYKKIYIDDLLDYLDM